MKVQKKSFQCVREGLKIQGTEFRPEGDKLPCIIISHGFMSNQKSVVKYAKEFAQLGYAAYCFDFCGGGLGGKSEGNTTQMSVLTEKEDLKTVISYVTSLPYVDSTRLILMGCSQGGFVSALTAAELQDKVAKLILFYPALCIPDDARKGKMMFAKFNPEQIPEEISCGLMKLGKCYPQSVLKMDPFEEISKYHGLVYIVHGTADNVVADTYAKRALETYNKEYYAEANDKIGNCQLLLIHNAKHGFTKQHDKTALFGVKEFINQKVEVLTVNVHVTGHTMEIKRGTSRVTLPFEGSAESRFFHGKIMPGAADIQDRKGMRTIRFCASYTINGQDYAGADCNVHIENVNEGKGWKPTVSTDSQALAFLNGANCDAYLESRKEGPIVRIFIDRSVV